MKKILFFDIDGTLVSETTHTIPSSAIKALNKAKEQGHLLFINTGRPKASISKLITDLPIDGYICGCGTYIEYQNKVIYHHQVDNNRVKEIKQLITQYNIEPVFESSNNIYFNKDVKQPLVKQIKEDYIKNKFNVLDIDDNLQFDKFTLWYQGDISSFRDNISKDFEIIDRANDMLEIMPLNHSKANGISKVVDLLNQDLDNCYVFGDSFNDESMLRYVKHSVVMGNGEEALKEFAYFVARDIEDDGILDALIKLKLIEKEA